MKELQIKKKTSALARAGLIAALYAALTLAVYPMSFGSMQLRLSEAMTLLPMFMPEAVPGLFVGCIVANLLTPHNILLDAVFGSLATLIAAYLTSKIKNRWLAPIPPVIINALIVGAVITVSTSGRDAAATVFLLNMLYVGAGQAIVCYGIGVPLTYIFEQIKNRRNRRNDENNY